jgi:hypothetical protein
MDKSFISQLESLSTLTRNVLNSCYNLNNNFTNWCDAGSCLLWYFVDSKYHLHTKDNYITFGKFNNEGHFWNVVNGIIVDNTVDQFGNYKTGVVTLDTAKQYTEKFIELWDRNLISSMMENEIKYYKDNYIKLVA